MDWDHQILQFAAAHRTEGLNVFFRAVTWLGSLYLLAPLAVVTAASLLYLQQRRELAFLVVGFGGATLWTYLGKALLARPRPALDAPLITLPTDSSFPSAHTTQIVAFALCAVLILRRILPEWQLAAVMVAAILAAVVGVSRIYLLVHFPSDVLGGMALAVVWIALVHRIL